MTQQNHTSSPKKQHVFNPRIIIGLVCSADLDTLRKLQEFFASLDGLTLIYIKTSGNPLYITTDNPQKTNNRPSEFSD